MKKSRVILSHNLQEYFKDEVGEAANTLGLHLNDLIEYYLVNMLCDFSRAGHAPAPGAEPLAFIYKRAVEAQPAQRVGVLKELGDIALYVAGFFTEFIERSLVDIDYYISMGGSAYASLAQLVGAQPTGETFAELYEAMGERFSELVDLLNEMRAKALSPSSDTELLRLYDRWTRTKSQRLERELFSRGLIPCAVSETDFVQ
ncbi:MAG: hypothetical protein AAFX94_15620 [Myxococcota bacterium]